MSLQLIPVNNSELISFLIGGESDGDRLQFFCHDEANELTYSEQLSMAEFLQRTRDLNKRVQFPTNVMRTTLISAKPINATMNSMQADADVELDGDQQDQQQQLEHNNKRAVLSLKYRIEDAAVLFKWEWRLMAVDSAMFYRHVMKEALHSATHLSKNLKCLLEVVKKKDKELKQFRIEGAELRRTTVVTEPFDVDAFNVQHEKLLADVAAFDQVKQLFQSAPVAVSLVKSDALVGKVEATALASTTPCSTKKTLSPRNRKRKVMESGVQHLERKVLQRRRAPKFRYKNTESQESDLEAALKECEPIVKAEAEVEIKAKVEIKAEAIADTEVELPTVAKIKREPSGLDSSLTSSKNELDEIMQIINRTAEQTKKMLMDHNVA